MSKFNFFLFIFLILQIYAQNSNNPSEKTETCDSQTGTCSMTNQKEEIKESNKKTSNKEKTSSHNKEDKKESTQTKEEPKKKKEKEKENALIYSDLFLNQPYTVTKNKTSIEETSLYFDFRINKKIEKYVDKYGMVPYPRERFIGKQQGNFLHFVH